MKKRKSPACRQAGFTLFELLVSISIIAILSAIASVSFGAAQKKARDSRRIEDITAIQKAAEMYYSKNGYQYPLWKINLVNQGLLQQLPTDPKSGSSDNYVYSKPDDLSSYCLCVKLENPVGNSDNSCNFTSNGDYFCAKNQQ